MKLRTIFEYEDLAALQPGVIVEMWDRVVSTGSGKRKFNDAFSIKEQAAIKYYYKILYKWHFSTGIPQQHTMTITMYGLLQRACNFFGSFPV